ncbi:hypothetical protein HDU83_008454 [Entophlyctis luteolus]|nr:hypothetical protein HDU83_008454 [Entophlyctis luteolus]
MLPPPSTRYAPSSTGSLETSHTSSDSTTVNSPPSLQTGRAFSLSGWRRRPRDAVESTETDRASIRTTSTGFSRLSHMIQRTTSSGSSRSVSSQRTVVSQRRAPLPPQSPADIEFSRQLSLPLRMSGFNKMMWSVGNVRPVSDFSPVSAASEIEDTEDSSISFILGRVFPISQSENFFRKGNFDVLDVACENGQWLDSIRSEIPRAQCFGINFDFGDTEKFTDEHVEASKNIHRMKMDTLSALPYGDKEFHFVHANLLLERVPTIHFVFLLNEIVRVAKSGSFVQLLEADLFTFRQGTISAAVELLENHYYSEMQKRGFELFAATNLAYYVKSEGKKAYLVYRAHRRVSIPLGYGNALERIHTRLRKQMFIRSADWMCSKMDMPLQEYLDLVESCFSEAVLEQEKPFVNYACVTFEVGSDNSHFFDL